MPADDGHPPHPTDPTFERIGQEDPDAGRGAPSAEPLYTPRAHAETVDPFVCRLLVGLGAVLCVLGICLPTCMAIPTIVGGGVLAGVAYAFRERRYSHLVLGLAVLALLLHGVAVMARGCASGGKGVVRTYERYLEDD